MPPEKSSLDTSPNQTRSGHQYYQKRAVMVGPIGSGLSVFGLCRYVATGWHMYLHKTFLPVETIAREGQDTPSAATTTFRMYSDVVRVRPLQYT